MPSSALCVHQIISSRCAICATLPVDVPTPSPRNRPSVPATAAQITYLAQLIVERGWPREEGGPLNKPGLKKEETIQLIKDLMPGLSKVDASKRIAELIVLPGLKRVAREADKAGIARAGICLTCSGSLAVKDGNAYIFETVSFRRVADSGCESLGRCRCGYCLFTFRVRVSCLKCREAYFRNSGRVDSHRNLAVEHPIYGAMYRDSGLGVAS